MENIRKLVLYLAMSVVFVLLFNAWQTMFYSTKNRVSAQSSVSSGQSPAYIPNDTAAHPARAPSGIDQNKPHAGKTVTIHTDVLDVLVSLDGGNVVQSRLLKYPYSLDNKAPLHVLDTAEDAYFTAQSGLLGTENIQFNADKSQYHLSEGKDRLLVVLHGHTKQGLTVEKTWKLARGQYAIEETITIHNGGTSPWQGAAYYQLIKRPGKADQHSGRSYSGGALSTVHTPYQKVTFKTLNTDPVNINNHGGWLAFQQPYFLSAWVAAPEMIHYYSHVEQDEAHPSYILGYTMPKQLIAPGKTGSFSAQLYTGPELAKQLAPLAKGLDLTIDYGWLFFLAKPVFNLLATVHHWVGNWGWAIILVTLLIKILLYPLSSSSYRSMAKMRALAPQMEALKQRHGDDRQALGQATMALYRKEKVNPAGGCLPMILQIPVFISLYFVLSESVQLRMAPFVLWIHDLSSHDPYYVLPLLMGLSMLLQQKLSPKPADPAQEKMMLLLPLVMTFFFLKFASGLVLYWVTNNCISMVQQWWIMRREDMRLATRRS